MIYKTPPRSGSSRWQNDEGPHFYVSSPNYRCEQSKAISWDDMENEGKLFPTPWWEWNNECVDDCGVQLCPCARIYCSLFLWCNCFSWRFRLTLWRLPQRGGISSTHPPSTSSYPPLVICRRLVPILIHILGMSLPGTGAEPRVKSLWESRGKRAFLLLNGISSRPCLFCSHCA